MTTETPEFIDALPYIDTAIDDDDEQRALAMKEVDDELEIFAPDKDYIEYLPPISRTFVTPLLEHEYSCIENNESRSQASDLAEVRIDSPPPSSSLLTEEELAAWSKSLNQVKIKLEYKQRQNTNLELIKSYGDPALQEYLAEQERLTTALQEELDDLNKKTQEVNWNRKRDQERTNKTLDVLKREWNIYIEKNRILSNEIKRLSSKI